MEKTLIDRREEQMKKEGVTFKTGVHIGLDISIKDLKKNFDAILLTIGSEESRDLKIPGREAEGIYAAMDFLPLQNKALSGEISNKQIKVYANEIN